MSNPGMSQTDRQTDKATHWKSAIFDVSGSDNYDKLGKLPSFVKEVHRKKEICPTTGNEHYQTHVICHRQVRFSQMCDWIRQTKWMPVIGVTHIENSINYVKKLDTTAPGAIVEIVKGEEYKRLHELLLVIARTAYFHPPEFFGPGTIGWKMYEEQFLFKKASKFLVSENLIWIDKLSNPVCEKMWNYFHEEVRKFAESELEEGVFIIEDPAFQNIEMSPDLFSE